MDGAGPAAMPDEDSLQRSAQRGSNSCSSYRPGSSFDWTAFNWWETKPTFPIELYRNEGEDSVETVVGTTLPCTLFIVHPKKDAQTETARLWVDDDARPVKWTWGGAVGIEVVMANDQWVETHKPIAFSGLAPADQARIDKLMKAIEGLW